MSKQAFDSKGSHIGTFDGEYLYDLNGKMSLRVDDDEVYTTNIPCSYVGAFEENEAISLDGKVLFRVEE